MDWLVILSILERVLKDSFISPRNWVSKLLFSMEDNITLIVFLLKSGFRVYHIDRKTKVITDVQFDIITVLPIFLFVYTDIEPNIVGVPQKHL